VLVQVVLGGEGQSNPGTVLVHSAGDRLFEQQRLHPDLGPILQDRGDLDLVVLEGEVEFSPPDLRSDPGIGAFVDLDSLALLDAAEGSGYAGLELGQERPKVEHHRRANKGWGELDVGLGRVIRRRFHLGNIEVLTAAGCNAEDYESRKEPVAKHQVRPH
jgi:hypothetical protein